MGPKSAYLWAVSALKNALPGSLQHWQDPQVVYKNHVQHHTPLRLLGPDAGEAVHALKRDRGETEWVRFLARASAPRECEFMLFPNPRSCPIDDLVQNKTVADKSWDTITIPSNWQFLFPKVDPPIYTNLSFPWKRPTALSTSVPAEDNPTGVYKIPFDISQQWLDAVQEGSRKVYLILHGAGPGVDIYVNGQHMGYGQDSMTETEVCISDAEALRPTGNELVLVVYRWTDGSYMEDQDQWWLSGVFRDVELSCRPTCHGIVDYFYETEIEESAREDLHTSPATVAVYVRTSDQNASVSPGSIRAYLFDKDGAQLDCLEAECGPSATFGREEIEVGTPTQGNLQCARIEFKLSKAHLWRLETPYLYSLVIQAIDGSGKVVQTEATRIGVRTVRIENGQVLVNSAPIIVCGVNRHEWDPKRGKVILEETMIQDIQLMKRYNFNAVRNCHYPNVHRWYELCSEYGLYVVDEANIETHGFGLLAHLSLLQNDPRWRNAFLVRVQAMVRRSRNNPCIIGWSLGNESGCGPNARACAEWVRKVDPTRTLQYEGGIESGDSPMLMGDGMDPYCTDIICPMYDTPGMLAKIAARTTEKVTDKNRWSSKRERPLILCEYAHAMGNSNGNLHHYFALFRSKKHPKIQGGFIWDWVDQGLVLDGFVGPSEKDWGYGGDFGPTSGKEDKTFCINGLVFPDRTPHPAMEEAKFLQRPLTFLFDSPALHVEADSDSDLVVEVELFDHAPNEDTLAFSFTLFGYCKGPGTEEDAFLSGPAEASHSPGPCVAARGRVKLVLRGAAAAVRQAENKYAGAFLLVEARLAVDLPWAPKSHLVAAETFDLRENSCQSLRPPMQALATAAAPDDVAVSGLTGSDGLVTIKGSSYECVLDVVRGSIKRVGASGVDLIGENGLAHSFFRAPTDNDLGGLDSMLPNRLLKPFVTKAQTSFNGFWRKHGLDKLESEAVKVDASGLDPGQEGSKQVRIVERHCAKGAARFETTTTYVFGKHSILVNIGAEALGATVSIPSLPRIGMGIVLPGDFDNVEYLGCGPFECYPDRVAGARFGVHKTTVNQMHTPYIMPSESGGRANVQWVRFASKKHRNTLTLQYAFPEEDQVRPDYLQGMDLSVQEPGASARPSGMCGAQFSASRYTEQELDVAQHQCDLPPKTDSSPVHVHVDTSMMGLGGDVSWMPKLHKQYRVKGKSWKYQVELIIGSKESTPSCKA